MHVRRTLAAAALVPLLLAGCQDDPEPIIPEPTASETPTPTESPSESEVAEEESAEEFIRRWQAVTLEAHNTGDTDEYRSLGLNCRPCRDFADQIERIYGDGGSIELEKLRVLRVVRASGEADEYRVTRLAGATRVLDASGNETQRFEGGRETIQVFLKETGAGWRVLNYARLPD